MPPRHAALAVLVAVVWGANFVVIDLGIGEVPPTLFVAVRFVVVLVPALFLVPRPRLPWRDVVVVGLFMSLGQFALLYTALAVGMPAGLASLVLQAQVGLTVLLAALALRERPSRTQVAGVILGAAGLGIVAVGRSAATPALGLVLVVAAATSWALGNVAVRRVSSRSTAGAVGGQASGGPTTGLSLTVWSATVVPVPLFLLALLLDGPDAVVHALTHPLGAIRQLNLHHGTLNAVLMPAVLRFNRGVIGTKWIRSRPSLENRRTRPLPNSTARSAFHQASAPWV